MDTKTINEKIETIENNLEIIKTQIQIFENQKRIENKKKGRFKKSGQNGKSALDEVYLRRNFQRIQFMGNGRKGKRFFSVSLGCLF